MLAQDSAVVAKDDSERLGRLCVPTLDLNRKTKRCTLYCEHILRFFMFPVTKFEFNLIVVKLKLFA